MRSYKTSEANWVLSITRKLRPKVSYRTDRQHKKHNPSLHISLLHILLPFFWKKAKKKNGIEKTAHNKRKAVPQPTTKRSPIQQNHTQIIIKRSLLTDTHLLLLIDLLARISLPTFTKCTRWQWIYPLLTLVYFPYKAITASPPCSFHLLPYLFHFSLYIPRVINFSLHLFLYYRLYYIQWALLVFSNISFLFQKCSNVSFHCRNLLNFL